MKKMTASLYLPIIIGCLSLSISSCKKATTADENVIRAVVASNIIDPGELVGNFEEDSSNIYQWHGIVCKDPIHALGQQYVEGNAAAIGIPVREGLKSARFIVRPGDQAFDHTSGERCEANHYNDTWNGYTQERNDDDFYYGWSTYIPTTWVTTTNATTGSWSILTQWHHRSRSSPPIHLSMVGNDLHLKITSGLFNGAGELQADAGKVTNYATNLDFNLFPSFAKGVWHDFIIHVRWTPNATGNVQVYHKLQSQSTFAQVFTRYNVSTMQLYRLADWNRAIDPIDNDAGTPDNAIPWGTGYVTAPLFYRLGLYRNPHSTITNTLYHDNWARATTYAAIANNF